MAIQRSGALEKMTVVGAVLAGLGAAACCVGPLLLAILGVAGGGLLVKFEPFRPYFIAGAAVALGFGFWLSYRKVPAKAGPECDCEMPKAARFGRTALWIATFVVALLVVSPYLVAWVGRSAPGAGIDVRGPAETITIPVEGMTCESCEVTIRTALLAVPGVTDARADASTGTAVVRFRPREVTPEKLVASINATGYTASPPRGRAPQRAQGGP